MIASDLVGDSEPLHDLIDHNFGLVANAGLRNEDYETLDPGYAVALL